MGDGAPEAASPFEGEKAPPSPRADLVTSAALMAFGAAVVVLALGMPTFAEQSGTGLTAPGIVPGFYGVVIAALAGMLALRTLKRTDRRPAAADTGNDSGRLALAAGLVLVYAGGLVGRLPFWLATALFVALFVAAFEWPRGPTGRPRRLVEAALIGLGTGVAVTLLFQGVFLVRLP